MMIIEKINMDSYKDAMNTAYVPAASSADSSISNTNSSIDTGGSRDFMGVFKESNFNIDMKDRDGYNPGEVVEDHRAANENEVNRNRDERFERERNKEVEEKVVDREEKSREPGEDLEENKKSEKQTESGDKSKNEKGEKPEHSASRADESPGVKKKDAGEGYTGKIREIIKTNYFHREEIGKIKAEIKDNFKESKSVHSGTNLEKLMLKNLEGQGNESDKVGDGNSGKNTGKAIKNGDEKVANEHETNEISEGKRAQGTEVDKKEDKAAFKHELKLTKSETGQENGGFHQVNDNIKNLNQFIDVKVKKALNHQNILEQYQVLKDSITNNVENGIKFLIANSESRLTMQLHPPELGKIQVELLIKDNHVNAKINTENTAVKEVILTHLDQLKSNLANAGTQFNKIEVEVGGFRNYFEQQLAQGKFGRSGGGNNGGSGSGSGDESSLENNDPDPWKIKNQQALLSYLGSRINCLI